MTTTTERKPVLLDRALYIGDNGRVFCGAHAGMSARWSGYDLSGHKVARITPAYCKRNGEEIAALKCEQCAQIARKGGSVA